MDVHCSNGCAESYGARGSQSWPASLGEFTETHSFFHHPDNFSSWRSDERPHLLPQDQENKEKSVCSWRRVSQGWGYAKVSPGRGCDSTDLSSENEGAKSSSWWRILLLHDAVHLPCPHRHGRVNTPTSLPKHCKQLCKTVPGLTTSGSRTWPILDFSFAVSVAVGLLISTLTLGSLLWFKIWGLWSELHWNEGQIKGEIFAKILMCLCVCVHLQKTS